VGARFDRAILDESQFSRCDLKAASFADASGAEVSVVHPLAADRLALDGASLPGLRLCDIRATGLSAQRLSARGLSVTRGDLPGACFDGADLVASTWTSASLRGASFRDATTDASRWLSCVLDGANAEGLKLENATFVDCSLVATRMARINGRCLHLRNCTATQADLAQAYLYRAMITGDPPAAMDLSGAVLHDAVLVQAYVAANLTGADLVNVRGAYARVNQSILAGTDLRGAQLFEVCAVKTDFTGACLAGVDGPLFADRCPGLEAAAQNAGGPATETLASQIELFTDALGPNPRRST
jgi:uncharacterized protein YjbI with pentapeptide repeats